MLLATHRSAVAVLVHLIPGLCAPVEIMQLVTFLAQRAMTHKMAFWARTDIRLKYKDADSLVDHPVATY